MDEKTRAEYLAKGAVPMTVQEWLGLDDAEMKLIEFQVGLAKAVRRRREAAGLSRADLAARLKVPPGRINSIESTTSSLLSAAQAFFNLGGDLAELVEPVRPEDPEADAGPAGPALPASPRSTEEFLGDPAALAGYLAEMADSPGHVCNPLDRKALARAADFLLRSGGDDE